MIYPSTLTQQFKPAVLEAAQQHARAEYPNESCGFIARGKYYACKNYAGDTSKYFEIRDDRYLRALQDDKLQAIVHSHPNGPIYPSEWDMMQQIATDLPFIIITLNDASFGEIVAWGDGLPVAPLVGRPFIHGLYDCYSVIRDAFRLGRAELAQQGIDWPFDPIELPEVPRDDSWWQKENDDLYRAHLRPAGFVEISQSQARPGDGFLVSLGERRANPHKRLNHAGLLIGGNSLLHHLPLRLSRREPAGIWGRGCRYVGPL
jgi:proteasome lid subunit RPN8/RPN11